MTEKITVGDTVYYFESFNIFPKKGRVIQGNENSYDYEILTPEKELKSIRRYNVFDAEEVHPKLLRHQINALKYLYDELEKRQQRLENQLKKRGFFARIFNK